MRFGTTGEVFSVFLKLGLTSFGGPIAHLGFFHRELIERRQWISESQYAQLLALCQFLPGPASSQLGFALGLLRANWSGAIAAFLAFTLPSALLLFGFAALLPQLSGPTGTAAIHGLKLVALAVVAHGVIGMARTLCPDAPRATIATASAVLILLSGRAWVQLLAVALGGLSGLALRGDVKPLDGGGLALRYGARTGWLLLAVFALLLVLLPLVAPAGSGALLPAFEAFYRAGALVFGAVPRILRRPRLRDAVWLGVGLAVLANTRPFEGAVVSLAAAVPLGRWFFRGGGLAGRLRRVVAPAVVVLTLTGVVMMLYNRAVTGDALRLPYTVVVLLLGLGFGFLFKHVESLEDYTSIGTMDPHTIVHVLLPVLIFESAFGMEVHTFLKSLSQILILAVIGLCM